MTARAPAEPGPTPRWVFLLGGLVAVGLLLAGASATAQSAALSAQKSQIESLEAMTSHERQEKTETIEKDRLKALGVSTSRIKADSVKIDELLKAAFTWDSGAAYETARAALQDRFGLNEKDRFFQTFMPPSRFNRDTDGKRYYYIDAVGLSSALGHTDAQVIAVTGTRYRYAVMSDVAMTVSESAQQGRPTSPGPRPSAIRRVLLYVTLDESGTVSDLTGVPPSGSTRSSR